MQGGGEQAQQHVNLESGEDVEVFLHVSAQHLADDNWPEEGMCLCGQILCASDIGHHKSHPLEATIVQV